jgi:aminomethyltransferase
MKRTPLYSDHVAAKATLVDFAGWEMPVTYGSTVDEVTAVRTRAGAFDASHMGEFRITGPQAREFVQYLTTNDATRLTPGRQQYSLMLNVQAGIIDDVIVRCYSDTDFLAVVNAGCLDKDWAWVEEQARGYDVVLVDESPVTALVAVQGPAARKIVVDLAGDASLLDIPRFGFATATIAGAETVVSRTGYTGEDGFELFTASEDAHAVWEAVVAAGVVPAGLGARDVLRLEAAYSLYGHELDLEHDPFESGVGWIVAMDKGPFIGRDALAERLQSPNRQKIAGLRVTGRGIPRQDCPVLLPDQTPAGIVTSGTMSPTLKYGIALARVPESAATIGQEIVIDIRGRAIAAEVVPLPFYQRSIKRTKIKSAE